MQKPTSHSDAGNDLTLPAFGLIEPERVLAMDELFAVVSDKFPVSPGHTLIIPPRPLTRFRELNAVEKTRLLEWVEWSQRHLEATFGAAGR
jgi:diadenosine tetraphosphate (Ap4A) HIT family hydrolase